MSYKNLNLRFSEMKAKRTKLPFENMIVRPFGEKPKLHIRFLKLVFPQFISWIREIQRLRQVEHNYIVECHRNEIESLVISKFNSVKKHG